MTSRRLVYDPGINDFPRREVSSSWVQKKVELRSRAHNYALVSTEPFDAFLVDPFSGEERERERDHISRSASDLKCAKQQRELSIRARFSRPFRDEKSAHSRMRSNGG